MTSWADPAQQLSKDRSAQGPAARPVRAAVVGMSATVTCGARDHAGLLAGALEETGVSCSSLWLERTDSTLRGSRAQVRAWARGLPGEIESARADVVLFHYSTFAYAHRGVPLFAHPALNAIAASGRPLLSVLHEFAYPWGRGGLRGRVWAASQRAALIEVVRRSGALLVTTEPRGHWLASRSWLPRRPIGFAPVFSNLPAPASTPDPGRERPLVGIFGYSYDGSAAALVMEAVRLLREDGRDLELRLLGAPGESSPVGRTWREAARARGVSDALTFSGILAAQELSDALGASDVLLFADPPGPTSRKGTLAGSLASGRPLVAVDGPSSWPELADSQAVLMAQPTPESLASALGSLLDDAALRESLGARGRSFANESMGLGRTADLAGELLRALLGRSPVPDSPL